MSSCGGYMVIQILDHITEEIKQIRIDVFMKEQGFTEEFDEIDETAKFVLLSIDGKAAGTCRYFPSDVVGDAHIGRSTQAVSWATFRNKNYDGSRKCYS
jgi:predicted GNAT family N-acyltransferase